MVDVNFGFVNSIPVLLPHEDKFKILPSARLSGYSSPRRCHGRHTHPLTAGLLLT